MEDLEMPSGSPITENDNEPSALNDPSDPLRPEIEEEDATRTPPLANPYEDMEAHSDEEQPMDAVEGEEAGERDNLGTTDIAVINDDDEESELEELAEEEFENFDPSVLNIPDKPLAVDESNVALLGVHKRKRTAEEEAERERKKKKKEKKRDKPKRSRRPADGEEDFEGGVEMDGKRSRKIKIGPDGKPIKAAKRPKSPEINEDELPPDERRRRALERKMDEALKSHRVSRRKQNQDLEERADQEIETMRRKMAQACELDAKAREAGGSAYHKLAILPEVVELMNRNTIQAQLVDPDINLLEAVRFMLEPGDKDAALPNYKIQRELFACLEKLNISKEALVASQIGKVVLFYTKSIQPQPEIKRQAEHLMAEWMRVVLNKHKNDSTGPAESRSFDPLLAQSSQRIPSSRKLAVLAADKRRRALAQPAPANRARVDGDVGTYTVQPVSTLSNAVGVNARKLGASGEDAFRKIAARSAAKMGSSARK